ncbi:serine/threonine-protein phosphatase 4 regulatory subunit 2 [Dendrobates tinctorius]|uniref:serine/threonine-protein phosphatase 4 regulatory subunit 2 n=1 Tax=Dendrobates tinctorius TaxID=92724 RepID=UPI003CC9ABE5
MDVDRLQEALKDFEKKGKKEVCSELDQFLSHVAKTGETIVQWPQFKDYFMFKLETVMDDFRSSAPEPRGPPNPNVEYIPFDEMKERILKIVTGFNGTPFTIQRLCELVTDPRRNYTGTDKFLRGVEKNVMVVSCVYPSSEKNNSTSINRMNGVMFPGNSQSYTDRSNINGPGTPRPLSRPKISVSSPMTTNGLPDGSENKDSEGQQKADTHSDSLSLDDSSPSTVKNKHMEEDPTEEHEVKRLKFDDEDEEQLTATEEPSSSQSSSEMTDDAEAVSTSEEAEESCDAELASEESLVTSSESATEEVEKESADVCVTEDTSEEESQQMEQSEASEPVCGSSTDEAESATSTSKADPECTEPEHPETLEKTPEIPPESPMDNSEGATDVAEEPMEQD